MSLFLPMTSWTLICSDKPLHSDQSKLQTIKKQIKTNIFTIKKSFIKKKQYKNYSINKLKLFLNVIFKFFLNKKRNKFEKKKKSEFILCVSVTHDLVGIRSLFVSFLLAILSRRPRRPIEVFFRQSKMWLANGDNENWEVRKKEPGLQLRDILYWLFYSSDTMFLLNDELASSKADFSINILLLVWY